MKLAAFSVVSHACSTAAAGKGWLGLFCRGWLWKMGRLGLRVWVKLYGKYGEV